MRRGVEYSAWRTLTGRGWTLFKLVSLLLGLAAVISLHAAERCASVAIKDERELWINGRRVIRDERGVNTPRWSPDGQQLAYVNEFDPAVDPVTHIVIIDRTGHVRQTIPVPESARFNFVDEMGWLNPGTIWVEGHVNPSVAIYDEFDLTTREMKHETYGTHFAPSPNGSVLAYRGNEPHPPRPEYQPPLMLDETAVKLPEGITVTGPIAWAPSGERLAASVQKNGRAGIAFVTARGMLERLVTLPSKGRNHALLWLNDESVVVRPGIQQQTYRVTRDGKVEESKTTLALRQRDDACRPEVAAQ